MVQLFFANWLAHCDAPKASQPAIIGNDPRSSAWGLYVADPSAPKAARALEPARLFAWLNSTHLTWRILPSYPGLVDDLVLRERRARATLIVHLAEQLYLRENGKTAPSVPALVPKYLKAIPPGYE